MYLVLEDGKLKELITKAIKKAGTYRKLATETKIPASTIYNYNYLNRTITRTNLEKLISYLKIEDYQECIVKELPDNWKQIIGGNNCVKKKLEEGKLDKQLKEARKNIVNGKRIGDWHKRMKKQNPEAYYKIQYEHFKKVANYKYLTENGEKVRNILEKQVANCLYKNKITYSYEPLVRRGNRYFFPDFLINNKIIIECTMWRGYDKAIKLKEKIGYLKGKYKVYVVIPKKIEKYYSSIEKNLILGIEDFSKLVAGFV